MKPSATETVAIWGDSLAKGVVWNEQRKRHSYAPATAAQVAADKLGIRIVNRARFGCTAPEGLCVMERDLADGVTCDAAAIEFGGNDCNFDWAAISASPDAQHEPATPPERFVASIRNMVAALHQRGVRPILMTLPPIDAERYFRFLVGDRLNAKNILKWLGDVQQIYRFQELYSLLIEKVAREYRIRMIDIRRRCLARNGFLRDMVCADGLHLSASGQRFVGEQIADAILREDA